MPLGKDAGKNIAKLAHERPDMSRKQRIAVGIHAAETTQKKGGHLKQQLKVKGK